MNTDNISQDEESRNTNVDTLSTADFLAAFFPDENEPIRLRALPPRGAQGRPKKKGVTRAKIAGNPATQRDLRALNAHNGLYFSPNSGGDCEAAIVGGEETKDGKVVAVHSPGRFNACFAEIDDLPIDEQHRLFDACPLPPSIRVETRKSVHGYWPLAGDNPGDQAQADWRDGQRRLIAYFQSDRAIKDPSRVMRLPGFDHVSADGSRKPVRCVAFDPSRRFTLAELLAAFPAVTEESRTFTKPTAGRFATWDALRAELGRRVMNHESATKNGSGRWDCRAICHDGKGDSGLFFDPFSNQTRCNKGCDQAEILRAFGLPEKPEKPEKAKKARGAAALPALTTTPAQSAPIASAPGVVATAAASLPDSSDNEISLERAKEILAGLDARLEDDPSEALAEDVIAAFELAAAESERDVVRADQVLKRYGVYRNVYAKLKERQQRQGLRLVGPAEQEDRRIRVDQVIDDPPIARLVFPLGYSLRNGKITAGGLFGEEAIIEGAVLITGRTEDVAGGASGRRVSWRCAGDSEWHSRNVDRRTLCDVRRILDLTDCGFPVHSGNAKDLIEFLAKFEAENFSVFPVAKTTTHLGWQGAKQQFGFLVGRTHIKPTGEIVEGAGLDDTSHWGSDALTFRGTGPGDDQVISGFRRGGTYQGWREAIKPIARYNRVLLPFYASFASPMLRIFDCKNFVINLGCPTSRGKTTAERVAASPWGKPDESAEDGIIKTWAQTPTSFERISAILNDLFPIWDDSKHAIKPEIFLPQAVYTHVSGQGKSRGAVQGIASQRAWRSIMLSSGEQPLTSFSNDGGTRMRVVEIEGAPFGEVSDVTGKTVDLLNLGVSANYGHAGPLFVQWVVKNFSKAAEWRANYNQQVIAYTKAAKSEKARRLAQSVAAIYVTAELVHEALDLPWEFQDPIEPLWTEIAEQAEDATGARRAFRFVLDWAESNQDRFYGRQQAGKDGIPYNAPAGGTVGRWDRQHDYGFIAFMPASIEELLLKKGFSHPDSIFSEWKELGFIETATDKPKRIHKLVRPQKGSKAGPVWMVVIRRAAIDSTREVKGGESVME